MSIEISPFLMFTFIDKPVFKEKGLLQKLWSESRWPMLFSWAPLVVIMVLSNTKIKHLNVLRFTKQFVKLCDSLL